jgi:fatty-acyl-CoA synthase
VQYISHGPTNVTFFRAAGARTTMIDSTAKPGQTGSRPRRLHDLLAGPGDDEALLLLPQRTVSFGEMRARASALAAGLKARGLRRGDRLALWLGNCDDWLAVALACSRLGAGLVSLNLRWGTKEIEDMLARTRCKAIVLSAAQRNGACAQALAATGPAARQALELVIVQEPQATPILDTVPQLTLAALATSGGPEVQDGQGEDEALIIATSGTTSRPKLVLHRQASVCAHAQDVARAAGLAGDATRMLLAVPMCGAYGYTILIATLAAQRPLVLLEAFEPTAVARVMREQAVTHMLGTNDMLDKLLDAVDGTPAFPALRMFGHANFVPSLTELPAKAQARGVLIRGFYGMSELLAGFAAQPADAPLAQRAEGGGRPVSAQACFLIRDPDTGREVAEAETGELQVRTPNRMAGYLDDPQATAAAFTPDGYFRTGDLANRLADGCFNFVSRMNDVLRIGGYLVAPAEIEEAIARRHDFRSVQVVAVDTVAGVRPVAFVVVGSAPFDERAVIAGCRDDLAIYKVPVRVFAIDAIPMVDGPNGQKVKRAALRERATELLQAVQGAA